MPSTKLYAAIYVVLFAFATLQFVVEQAGLLRTIYWTAFAIIIALSIVKAVLVAGWYQHLKFEPRSLTALVLIGLTAVLALTFAAAYSIT